MEIYHINDLERLSGIKAHTIRIWEKRYELIAPHRTSTNRRYYSDSQLKKLLNVTTLLSQGQKISHIAAMTEEEINQRILEEMQGNDTDKIAISYINDLVKSMLSYDEIVFEQVCASAFTRFGIHEALINIIYPFLVKAGILWVVDRTAPAQEHFASCLIRRKLIAAIDGLLPSSINTKKFLLFLPEDEWHEIGLLFADYIIRSKGYQSIYLGQSVPFENVKEMVATLHPTHLLLFYVTTRPKKEMEQNLDALTALDAGTKVLVAGKAEILPRRKSKQKNMTYLTEVNDLVKLL